MKTLLCALVFLSACVPGFSQSRDRASGVTDVASVSVGRLRPAIDGKPMPHPYHVEARHWPEGCEAAKARYDATGILPAYLATPEPNAPLTGFAASMQEPGEIAHRCGEKFYEYDGENLTTSAGETAISQLMSATSGPPAQANYIALTNTAITAAVGDTTLSGEISSNGLSRSQGTFTDTSAAIGTPPTAGSLANVGTTGANTPSYWVFACTMQGCTAVGTGAAGASVNSTLSTANYVTGSFTGKLGAAYYRIIRTHNSSSPSGALAGGSTMSSSDGEISAGYVSCGDLVAGTAPACTFADQSTTVNAFTVPASDQTFVGKYTLTKTFTATGAQSAQAFGIFNASSVGTLFFEGTFSSASLVTNDTLAFTETVFH